MNIGSRPNTTSVGPLTQLVGGQHLTDAGQQVGVVSMAGWGDPAVPEVKISTATSSGRADDRCRFVVEQRVDVDAQRPRLEPGADEGAHVGRVDQSISRRAARAVGGLRSPLLPTHAELVRHRHRRVGRVERHGDQSGAEGGQVRHDEVPVVAGDDGEAPPGSRPISTRRRRGRHLRSVVGLDPGISAWPLAGWGSMIVARFTAGDDIRSSRRSDAHEGRRWPPGSRWSR